MEAWAGHADLRSSRYERADTPLARPPHFPTVLQSGDRFGLVRAGSRSDLGRKVFLLLLDAFTELEANKALERDARASPSPLRRRRRQSESCRRSRTARDRSALSLRNLARPPSTIFSTMFCGLPLSFAFSIAIERSRSTRAGSRSSALSERFSCCRGVHRNLLAQRSQRVGRSATSELRARRSCRDLERPGCERKERRRPRSLPRPRRGAATDSHRSWRCCSSAPQPRFRPPDNRQPKGRRRPCPSRERSGRRCGRNLEDLVLGDEIGLRVYLDDRAPRSGDCDSDETLRGRASRLLGGSGTPFVRSQSMAASISPLVSASAFLQIIPAPALAGVLYGGGRNLSHVSYPLTTLDKGPFKL